MKFFFRLFSLLVIYCLDVSSSTAQIIDTTEVHRNENGKIRFARIKPHSENSVSKGGGILLKLFKADKDNDYQIYKQSIDGKGLVHTRYQQYYKGIKVEFGTYLTHGKNSVIETINGDYIEVNNINTSPSINESEALKRALRYVGSKVYKWNDKASENFIKEISKDSQATYYPEGSLIIAEDQIINPGKAKLAWKFQISSKSPDNEQVIYVDAHNGGIIRNMPLIYESNVSLTAETRYSGTKTITGDSYTGGYRLTEARNGVSLQTQSLQYSSSLPGADIYNSSSSNFTSTGWTGFSSDRVALDVHWATEQVYDFWNSVFGRNGLDGSGLRMLSFIHWGSGTNNATWIGNNTVNPNNNNYIRIGDGDGSTFYPLGALDVVAHEYAHGISQFTGLGYDFTETGAVNEGISDIWGSCIEYWVDPSKQTWKIGEEVMANGAPAIRSMLNPKTGGDPGQSVTGGYPDTYKGQFWDKGNEPHTNSTVMSHWFYLLVNGGSGSNDNFDGYNLTGIGISNAQAIMYKTQTDYLTSGAQYADVRIATILAAQALYGSGSCQEIAVTNAWYAVGVGGIYTSSTTPVISGLSAVCTSESYTASNLPSGGTVTWSISNTIGASIYPNGNSATVNRLNDGVTAVMVNVTGGCNLFMSKTVTLGTPTLAGGYINTFNYGASPLGIYPGMTNDACMGYYINTDVNLIGGSSIAWNRLSSSTPISWSQVGNNLQFYIPSDGATALFEANASNTCGTTTKQFQWQASNCAGTENGCTAFTISPNPSTGYFTIATPSVLPPCNGFTNGAKISGVSDMTIQEIRIYDNLKNLRKIMKGNSSKQMTVSAAALNTGVYFVEIKGTHNYKETKQLIIQK
jgi:Zn-dependent metalloprotease